MHKRWQKSVWLVNIRTVIDLAQYLAVSHMKAFIQSTLLPSLWLSAPFYVLFFSLPNSGLSMPRDVFDAVFLCLFSLLFVCWGLAILVLWRRVNAIKHVGWKRIQLVVLALSVFGFFLSGDYYGLLLNALVDLLKLPLFLICVHLLFVIPPWVYEGFKNKS